MGGICGIINFKDKSPVNPEILSKMMEAIIHRGPNDEGKFIENYAGLGIRRLSIIDIEGGHQPITNEDGTLVIVFNGEIYNFRELRQELINKCHKFKTFTDTEVILHLYEEKGENCLDFLNGMFAFCIWDRKNKKLFLARDRLGIKPFYYSLNSKGISFASELKSLIQNPLLSKKLNDEAITDYFALGYILSPKTVFRDINSLSPGHFLTVSNCVVKENSYWDLKFVDRKFSNENEILEEFLDVLSASVKRHMISDVPLGAFLSGGIDSSSVVSLMQAAGSTTVKTFSILINEEGWNEGKFIKIAEEHFKTEHHESVIDLNVQELLSKTIWYNDEPFADSSSMPTFLVSNLAQTKVKVALSGDGGDENLAGYPTYIADKMALWIKSIPGLSHILSLLQKPVSYLVDNPKIPRFIEGLKLPLSQAHCWWRVLFTDEERKNLFSEDFSRKSIDYNPYSRFETCFNSCDGDSFLKKAMYTDIKTWLADDILKKVDRASMANSLEVRVPFLDYKVVEFCASVPDEFKLSGFKSKYLLKKAMNGKIPEPIIARAKRGFHLPVSKYLKTQLKDMALACLSKSNIEPLGILNYDYVNLLLSEHMKGERDHGRKIWALLCFSLWHEIYFRKSLNENQI